MNDRSRLALVALEHVSILQFLFLASCNSCWVSVVAFLIEAERSVLFLCLRDLCIFLFFRLRDMCFIVVERSVRFLFVFWLRDLCIFLVERSVLVFLKSERDLCL